ncbi:MAG TPA: hypothetical protein ENG19_02920 [Candidatus Bathyarchaeota archaeon]|nr:hypothetical protein [Candidatus Bathyarchaeota archaeon]
MEDWHIIVNIVSLIINVSLVYFAVRLLWIFRGGIMGRPWRFIASGVLALAVSSTIFSLHYLLNLGSVGHAIGGLIMMIGGLLLLIGMYLQYKSWAVHS